MRDKDNLTAALEVLTQKIAANTDYSPEMTLALKQLKHQCYKHKARAVKANAHKSEAIDAGQVSGLDVLGSVVSRARTE